MRKAYSFYRRIPVQARAPFPTIWTASEVPALKKQGITCRAYYFSRMSYRTKQEFAVTLSDLFSQAPEDEDRLHSSAGLRCLWTQSREQRWEEMAAFLKTFRAYHNRC